MAGSPQSNPRITVTLNPAAVVDAFDDRRDLIFGQIGTGGTAIADGLVTDLQVANDADLQTLFGTGDLYWRIRKWREAVQVSDGGPLPILDAIGAAAPVSGSPVAAFSTLVFGGVATEATEFTVSVIDGAEFTATVSVAIGDTANEIATATMNALNDIGTLPFIASNAIPGTTTIAATDVGVIGNDYGLSADFAVSGLTILLTGFATGAEEPVLTATLDAMDGTRYTGVGWPESWDRSLIIAEMDTRFNTSNSIMDGVAFQGSTDTYANNAAIALAENSQSFVIMGNNLIADDLHAGPAILTPADWAATQFLAIRDKRLTPSAPIGDLIVVSNAGLDSIGGPSLASLPYFNSVLEATEQTAPLNLYNDTENLALEGDGFTTYGPNRAGSAMIMGVVSTTWTTDDAGNDNSSFHFLNFVDTGSVCREIFFNTLKATYAQTRLTDGIVPPGRSMANEQTIKAELLAIYRTCANLALTQSGPTAEAYFGANTTVVVSLPDRLVTISGPLPIVSQLGQIDYDMSLAFSIDSTDTLIAF